jgi:hypothetical protein
MGTRMRRWFVYIRDIDDCCEVLIMLIADFAMIEAGLTASRKCISTYRPRDFDYMYMWTL